MSVIVFFLHTVTCVERLSDELKTRFWKKQQQIVLEREQDKTCDIQLMSSSSEVKYMSFG